MSALDLEQLRRQYRDWPTEDLLRLVAERESYRPEAVHVVREILAARDPAEVAVHTDVVATEQRLQEAVATEPLSWGLRVACLVFCGIPGIAVAVLQESQRKKQAARDAWRWFGYGVATWFALGFLRILLLSL